MNGNLYAVWEDARFSGVDEIAFAMSTDSGVTWSTPVKINKTPRSSNPGNEQAFTPSIRVAGDGTIAVSYYDFRNNTPAPGLPTDYWLVHCHARLLPCGDPANWSETHVAGSFDMETAPSAGGLFLGDYQGLASVGNNFEVFFVQTNSGNTANRTDVFSTIVGP